MVVTIADELIDPPKDLLGVSDPTDPPKGRLAVSDLMDPPEDLFGVIDAMDPLKGLLDATNPIDSLRDFAINVPEVFGDLPVGDLMRLNRRSTFSAHNPSTCWERSAPSVRYSSIASLH